MLEYTLLLIKSDCRRNMKKILQNILANGFLIICRRTVLFSPEHAAEFYKEFEDEPDFMHKVIVLSKGPVEALVLSKANAINDLNCLMIHCHCCHPTIFEQNFHISETGIKAEAEIHFIFPNLICEPVPQYDAALVCDFKPLTKNLIEGIHNILQGDAGYRDWKTYLSEWLTQKNANLPIVSHECNNDYREPETTLKVQRKKCDERHTPDIVPSSSDIVISSTDSSRRSSLLLTTSSCLTCGSFEKSNNSSLI